MSTNQDISCNSFPYGRWNNTSTNLKLYRPMYNACYYTNPNFVKPHLTNNNLFSNTSYQMSKKELYSYLSKNRAYLNR